MTDHTIKHETKIQDGVYFLLRNGQPALCPFRPSIMNQSKLGHMEFIPVHCNTVCPFHNTIKNEENTILHTIECTGKPIAINSSLPNNIKPL